jgi:predicted amidohydrolase YtcJ
LAFGSDAPVASLDPREGLYAALARRDVSGGPVGGWRPEERLRFDEIVHGYTVGPAIAAGLSHRSGTLTPGHDADLVAWTFDPSIERGEGDAARAGRARLTVIAGEVVMQQ